MPERDLGRQRARPAAGYELAAAKGDQLFKKSGRQRRANRSLAKRQAFAVDDNLIDRQLAHLAPEREYLARARLRRQRIHDILEEAQHRVRRDIDRCDHS